MTNAEQWLSDLETKAKAATPGKRYLVETDDDRCMNAVYIATQQDDAEPGEKPENVIAVTLLQSPPVACIADGKWDENAALIVATDPAAVLRLVGMVRWLAKGCDCDAETCMTGCTPECQLEMAYNATEAHHD